MADEPIEGCRICNGVARTHRITGGPVFHNCETGLASRKRYEHAITGGSPGGEIPSRLRECSVTSATRIAASASGRSEILAQIESGAARAINPQDYSGEERSVGISALGPVGVGKSGFLASMVNEIRRHGLPVCWIDYMHLIRRVRSEWGKDYDGRTIVGLQRAPIVVIDDIGDPFRERGDYAETESKRDILYTIVAARCAELKPTFITANYGSLDELAEQFDPRLADRLQEANITVAVGGESLRRNPK